MVHTISAALRRLLVLLALTGTLTAPDPAAVQAAQFPVYAALMPAEAAWLSENYCGSNALILTETHPRGDAYLGSAYVYTELYLPDVHCLKTWYADDPSHADFELADIRSVGWQTRAAFAVNGDFYTIQGVNAVRNGQVLNTCVSSYDLCVLYEDGSMKAWPSEELSDLKKTGEALRNAWQAWSFGPALLGPDGSPISDFSSRVPEFLCREHARTAIGYYSPGHYCIVSVFGFRDDSLGVTLDELSRFFASRGCVQAYNLDGGTSTHLWLHGDERGWPGEPADLADFIYIEDLSPEG